MNITKDGRGRHGKCGRKPTGRVRDVALSIKLTAVERDAVIAKLEKLGKTRADSLLEHLDIEIKDEQSGDNGADKN